MYKELYDINQHEPEVRDKVLQEMLEQATTWERVCIAQNMYYETPDGVDFVKKEDKATVSLKDNQLTFTLGNNETYQVDVNKIEMIEQSQSYKGYYELYMKTDEEQNISWITLCAY